MNSQQQLENNTQTSRIELLKMSVAIAIERTRTPIFDIEKLVDDLTAEFPRLPIADLTQAIKNGGLGKYGRTYRFSTQEVCIWVRQYLKDANGNLVL